MGKIGTLSSIKDTLNDELIEISISYGALIFKAIDNGRTEIADLHSRSLIVLMADCVERYKQELSIETNRRYILAISNLSNWALLLRSASNWVRHHSEWYEKYYYNYREKTRENIQSDGTSSVSTNIEDYNFKKHELNNIKRVLDLVEATDVEELFHYGNGSAYKIVRKLNLDNFDEASKNFLEFIHETI